METQASDTIGAATRLGLVLTAENAALRSLDMPAAAALLDEKLAAARALSTASAVRPGRQTPEAAGLALRLRELAEENRHLLERAIQVQGRVLDMVARAARQGAAQSGGRYGAGGMAALDRRATALQMRA